MSFIVVVWGEVNVITSGFAKNFTHINRSVHVSGGPGLQPSSRERYDRRVWLAPVKEIVFCGGFNVCQALIRADSIPEGRKKNVPSVLTNVGRG
jgi:hypothetical protein